LYLTIPLVDQNDDSIDTLNEGIANHFSPINLSGDNAL
jgi:hypothetical protein